MVDNTFPYEPMVMKAKSEADCHAEIRKIHGNNYKVIRKQETLTDALFPFMRKKQWELTYIPLALNTVNQNPVMPKTVSMVPKLDFETEQAKIVSANQNMLSPQMKLIVDELSAISAKIDQKVSYSSSEEHQTILTIDDLLKKNEFTEAYIKKICDKIKQEFSFQELEDMALVGRAVVDWIGESIQIATEQELARPEVILLVGPTGVGKTTTVAKLAANYSGLINSNMQHSLNIRLVTTDTVRIGAREQLERYGNVMEIPVSFAQSHAALQDLLSFYRHDVDVIFIDTSGQSPKDYEALARMRKNLELKTKNQRVYLTVSASTKANDLRTIIQQYEIFGYESIIVTKLDETESIGTVVSILNEKNKSIAYITDGQKVPRNLKKADVVSFLINLNGFNIDRAHIDNKFAKKEVN